MGRPLYSRPAVTVRVANEDPPAPATAPAQPTYEKWSYWNAFDPDADEWFEGDDAVYEAFITDPSQVVPNPLSPTSPVTEEDDGPIIVSVPPDVIRAGSPLSSGSSEAGEDNERARTGGLRILGESGSYSEESDDEIEGSVVVVNHRPRIQGTSIEEGGRVYTVDEFIMRDEGLFDAPTSNQMSSAAAPTAIRVIDSIPISVPVQVEEFEVPRTPPRAPRLSSNSGTASTSWTTTPLVFASPSPPPSVTPRLYSWSSGSRGSVLPPPPMSPTANRGPLPNRSARMSVAHIQPAFVNRIRG